MALKKKPKISKHRRKVSHCQKACDQIHIPIIIQRYPQNKYNIEKCKAMVKTQASLRLPDARNQWDIKISNIS